MENNFLFFAKLRGSEEVPPVSTDAQGLVQFVVSSNEKKMGYRLTVNNLDNFTEAHLHLGKKGMNGPVVVFLFGPTNPGISVTEGVVQGVITADNLVGPLEGRSLSTLVELMREGKTYVNAHTTQNPDGEIRGQIRSFFND